MTAQDHNKLLSVFFFIQGGLQLFGGVLAAAIYGGMGVFMLGTLRREEEQLMGGIFVALAVVFGIVILLFGAFYVLTGLKVMKMHPIGRTLGIIASCIALLGFPLGTALGIYGLWFFFGDMGKNLYSGLSVSTPPPTPPGPSSWQ